MQFSNNTDESGIVERTRKIMRVDATQWSTKNITNSANDWLDEITGYAIGADRRFQWDDTNHSHLPIGTTNLIANQSDYSFLVDEQGNSILNLTRIDMLDDEGNYTELKVIDQAEIKGALNEFHKTPSTPIFYDKIADNIIRLYPTPDISVTAGLKFYFQRTPSYFTATDTTKQPGVAPLLHKGFVVASAYDGAFTLGLDNLQALGIEREVEKTKMKDYFMNRNTDEVKIIRPKVRNPQ